KVKRAIKETNITEIAIAGGVSANSGLRSAIVEEAQKNGWKTYIPKIQYSTDNAAMIAIAGYFKFLDNDFSNQSVTPYARSRF
ncbi:MAG: tRNA (adenosine(37)-N6)-threonylcarbamoyltransferase complex transferase subunit TsaD, partial [Marinilabiliales bacterium]